LLGTTDSSKLLASAPGPPTEGKPVVKRRLLITFILIGLLAAIPLSRAGATGAATQSTRDVTLILDPPPERPIVVGTSTLTRTDSSLSFSLSTTGLEPGHAVTIWWMVANPDGGVAVLYGAGHVIDADGTAEFGGSLKVGDSNGYEMGDDRSLEDARGATVFLVVRDHGPAKPGIVEEQIHTFGVCNPPTPPETPLSCTDLQMSEHKG
jgi:hypothetical protein